MEKRNLTIYYKTLGYNPNTLLDTLGKKSVYSLFFDLLDQEFNIFFSSGIENYLGKNMFNSTYIYKDQKFSKHQTKYYSDVIYDRSGGVQFPADDVINAVNPLAFKSLAHNKFATYELLQEFQPQSMLVKEMDKEKIPKLNSKFIIKDQEGMKGKGIELLDFSETNDQELFFKEILPNRGSSIIQEYVSPALPIELNLEMKDQQIHDLRLYIIGAKPQMSVVRKPAEGDFRSNVAQGGIIYEVSIDKVLSRYNLVIENILSIITKQFGGSLAFSIDFMIDEEDKLWLIELNSQFGFPWDKMKSSEKFIRELVQLLKSTSI